MIILTAHVVGPTDDTDGVKAAVAASLVPVHPAVGHAVPRIDRRGEAGDAGGGVREVLEVLDGRGDLRLARRAAGRDMVMGLIEGIVIFAGSGIKSGVSWYTVGWDVAN